MCMRAVYVRACCLCACVLCMCMRAYVRLHTLDFHRRYDDTGRLTKLLGPAGRFTRLDRVTDGSQSQVQARGNGHSTTVTSTDSYQSVTLPYGGKVTSTDITGETRSIVFPDGLTVEEEASSDAVWGEQLQTVAKMTVKLPSGITQTIESNHYASLKQPFNPLSLTKSGHTIKVNVFALHY